MGISGQNALNNLQNLKANLPISGNTNTEGMTRSGYSHPLMVLPSGQTVPMSAFYGQQSSAAETGGLPYVPTGMFPGFVNSTNLNAAAMQGYNWPYGVPANLPALDEARRGSWSSNDENGPVTPAMVAAGHVDYYNGYQGPATTSSVPQYIAGPIQPMKTADNKSYEMVNLDNLTQLHPGIPRAVPALWTNQEELSLAKCLQNPEGITNIYIRGFMPDTTDEDLEAWASRFGEIESCKAIIEQDTGKCKGYVSPHHSCLLLLTSLQVRVRLVLLSSCRRELHSWLLPPWLPGQLCTEVAQLSPQGSRGQVIHQHLLYWCSN